MIKQLEVVRREHLKEKPDMATLGFGTVFTDYMLSMDYNPEQGWHNAVILPYQNIELSPAAQVLHYGQAVFEGMKAYRTGDEVRLFRPEENFRRMNQSNARLNMPEVDIDFMVDTLKQLVTLEKDWIPTGEGQSLYIRPFVIATEAYLGVRAATHYKLLIILSPVGAYYGSDHLLATKIYVEDEYVRAVRGGVGFAKVAGNYAASLMAQTRATELGYDQVLWLDGVEQRYVEEVGSMNIFFVIDGTVVTPELNGSILPGITRKSILELAQHLGYPVEERRISIDDVFEASQAGTLQEIFGSGTAAVIAPVGSVKYKDQELVVNNGQAGLVTLDLYNHYTGIQNGTEKDPFGWCVKL
ncbi:branched-chain amino acid aminotransferase [Macrococcus equipercicus]|uniref:Branched-chain-amino-acid aminotransferase n=1 Tax=Macrococcus equipercicus TaxID=69967 RepID=A0A9Q9BLB8_9STAP|nr:branched-chain amino acid aminotransferase [Macrococcus equipercicus]KAA1039377.1 branched-chain amino acid aminotransferase [Macrococcus equipercicus]UTH13668.1 branched-chain amino acid aminotransferase [Macrococcus equipercicus]